MEGFTSSFAKERNALLDALSALSTVPKDQVPAEIDSLQQRVVKLNASYTSNASSIPTYDQRRCQEQLKQLSEAIAAERTKSVPKQKFSFKSRSRHESPVTSTPTTPPPTAIIAEPTNTVPDNGVTLSASNAYLSIPGDSHPSNLRLLSMSTSVINLLRPKRHATLHAKDLSDCLILASSFDGAAHLTNLTNCIVVLKCHQFRMHDSRDTDVYLSCSSRPIIENSTNIAFSEYPNVIGKTIGIAVDREEWLDKELVEDFNWLRKEHSPNWRISQDAMGDDTWTQVMELIDQGSASSHGLLDLVMKQ